MKDVLHALLPPLKPGIDQARALVDQERYPEALAEAARVLEVDPGCGGAFAVQALVAARTGQPVPEEALTRAVELSPGESWIRALSGAVRLSQGRLVEALAELGLADDGDSAARLNRAFIWLQMGEPVRALADLERVPLDEQATELKITALAQLGRFQEVVDQTTLPGPWFFKERAKALRHLGRLKEAAADFVRVLDLHPDELEALFWLGSLRSQIGQLEEALGPLRRCLEIHPGFGAALHELGMTLDGLRQHREAIACYDGALAGPEDARNGPPSRGAAGGVTHDWSRAETHLNRANSWSALGQAARALEDYAAAAGIRPDWHLPLLNRGLLLRELGRLEASLDDLEAAARLAPSNGRVRYELGLSRLGLDQAEAAHEAYLQASELDPRWLEFPYRTRQERPRVPEGPREGRDWHRAELELDARLHAEGLDRASFRCDLSTGRFWWEQAGRPALAARALLIASYDQRVPLDQAWSIVLALADGEPDLQYVHASRDGDAVLFVGLSQLGPPTDEGVLDAGALIRPWLERASRVLQNRRVPPARASETPSEAEELVEVGLRLQEKARTLFVDTPEAIRLVESGQALIWLGHDLQHGRKAVSQALAELHELRRDWTPGAGS